MNSRGWEIWHNHHINKLNQEKKKLEFVENNELKYRQGYIDGLKWTVNEQQHIKKKINK